MRTIFKNLRLNEEFEFEGDRIDGRAQGPWRKTGARSYEHVQDPRRYGRIKVGTWHVTVVTRDQAIPRIDRYVSMTEMAYAKFDILHAEFDRACLDYQQAFGRDPEVVLLRVMARTPEGG